MSITAQASDTVPVEALGGEVLAVLAMVIAASAIAGSAIAPPPHNEILSVLAFWTLHGTPKKYASRRMHATPDASSNSDS
jgi:hypothetical protein